MTLADLIDLEAQLARDRDVEPDALEARDRAWLAEIPEGARRDREGLLRGWLDAGREAEPGRAHPGAAVERALGATRALLVFVGLVLGWASATGVLAFSGEHPVNVWDFLLAFVGIQVLLLALLALSFFLPLGAVGRPAASLVRGAVAWLYSRFAARSARSREQSAEWSAFWHRLRSRRSLYHRIEPWLLLGTTQGFGVAFNVGALVALMRLVVFSDLAFAWGTTLVELDAPRFHALVAAIAAPWRGIWPDAVPSPDLVAATRYSRLEGAYLSPGAGRALRPDAVGEWWKFLAVSLAFYGLAPRVLLLALARLRTATLLRRLPLDDAEVTRVVRRLSEPHVDTRSASAPEIAARRAGVEPPHARGAGAASRCAVVLWRDVPSTAAVTSAVAAQAGCSVATVQPAGGRDYDEGGVDWARVASGADSVVVVAESFEAPDRATARFLRSLRTALGPRRHVLVLLAGAAGESVTSASPQAVRLWREGLSALEDPWLSVEALRGSPAASSGATAGRPDGTAAPGLDGTAAAQSPAPLPGRASGRNE